MKAIVQFARSDAWVLEERVKRGENVPGVAECEIDYSELSESMRRRLLSGTGKSRFDASLEALYFNAEYKFVGVNESFAWGNIVLRFDGDKPTAADVEMMLDVAFAELDAKRQAYLDVLAAKQEETRQFEQAKEILKDLLQSKEHAIKAATEDMRNYRERLETVTEFLQCFPPNQLREALERCDLTREDVDNVVHGNGLQWDDEDE